MRKTRHLLLRRAIATVTTVATVVGVGFVGGSGVAGADPAASWLNHGNGLSNWRSQPSEEKLDRDNVGQLAPKWVYHPGGDVSATPSVEGNAVYVPDWTGNVARLDAATGNVVWKTNLNAATGIATSAGLVTSRDTPTIAGDTVLVGTQKGAFLLALDKATGAVRWRTQVDANGFAILTQSPVVRNGVVYQGVASTEEAATAFIPNYPCCFFRGSVNAIDLATGQLIWKTYMTPATSDRPSAAHPAGSRYSGAAVWGSSPVVDPARGSLYITTGNNYSVPESVANCTIAHPDTAGQCDADNNYVDSILSLDLATGVVKWVKHLDTADAWNVACFTGLPGNVNPGSCPTPAGPDFDFGQGAMLIPTKTHGVKRDVVAAGQKSGVFWGVDADTGQVLWTTQAGPGGTLGGLEWGSATDGKRIYFAISNNSLLPYTSPARPELGNAGSWGALDPATGAILWQTKDPNGDIDPGAVSVANNVVYAGSLASPADPVGAKTKKTFFGLNAANGKILWSFASGASVNSGPAIVDATVYWGSGYRNFGLGVGNDAFYALTVKGK